MKRYPAILGSFYNTPLCIHPAKAEEIAAFLDAKITGAAYDPQVAEEPQGYCLSPAGEQVALDKMSAVSSGDSFLAVLPLFGTMYQHGGMEMDYSGGTSTEKFGAQFSALDANPAVKTIVIHTHSPGGQIWGTAELSDLIYAARERKQTRIVAAGNSMIASAATWVATAASKVYLTPGGEMGSVGVIMMHTDVSVAEEKRGIKRTIISTSDKKIEGHPYAPLADETAAAWLAECQQSLVKFHAALARNRETTPARVEGDFGGGGMLRAADAVKAGMADGVMSFRDVIGQEMERLRVASVPRSKARANANDLLLAETLE